MAMFVGFFIHFTSPSIMRFTLRLGLGNFFVLATLLLTGLPSVAENLKPSKIAMWRIRSPQNTVFLLGSVHVGQSCTLNSPRIEEALKESETAVFELDYPNISAADKVKLGMRLSEAGLLEAGDRTLKESVDAETYQKIAEKFNAVKPANLPLSLDLVNELYKPMFIAYQIQGFSAQKQGFTGECGVDQILVKKAESAGKNIVGLETFEFQTDLLTSVFANSTEENVTDLFESLLKEEGSGKISALLNSVTNGDLKTVEETVVNSCKNAAEICDKLLDQRNENWLETIKGYLNQSDDYFVVVGAAHMVGKNNLIQLLQRENYAVENF